MCAAYRPNVLLGINRGPCTWTKRPFRYFILTVILNMLTENVQLLRDHKI